MGWLAALKKAVYRLVFSEQRPNEERPETADFTHHDELQCRHCGHIHGETDGSCACGCAFSDL